VWRTATTEVERCLDVFFALALLQEPLTEAALNERLAMAGRHGRRRTASALLRRLRAAGLVRELDGPTGNAARFRLTAAGRRALGALRRRYPRLYRLLDPQGAGTAAGTEITPLTLASERAELAAMRRDLERQRSDLLSTVSHELRTPLTLIRTSVGLLLDSNPEPAMRARLLQNVKHSADRMHSLVGDLLDLVRLNSGKAELQLRYVDVNDLVFGATNLMRPLLEEKGQRLSLLLPATAPRVMADHRRLEQVFLNLLSNANKFAPQGAAVSVSVREAGTEVVVSVRDSGPGIGPEAQVHLFEQFYTARTSSPSRSIGAGLGLPIAKGIVEAHGGRIWVESEVGTGSEFFVALPIEGPRGGEADEDTSS
jgi:signal transduction histidine kinase